MYRILVELTCRAAIDLAIVLVHRIAIHLVKTSAVRRGIICFSGRIQMKFTAYFLILRFIITITCGESKAFESNFDIKGDVDNC